MIQNGYLHRCLLPLNVLQDWNPNAGRPVGNSPEFMPLDKSLNCDISHSLHIHSILSCYILDGEANRQGVKGLCASVTQQPREKSPED